MYTDDLKVVKDASDFFLMKDCWKLLKLMSLDVF